MRKLGLFWFLYGVWWLCFLGFQQLYAAPTVGPYICSASNTGTLSMGPYSCSTNGQGQTQMSVTVTVDPKVNALNQNTYRIVQNLTPTSVGQMKMVAAGTVPAGTPCDISQKIALGGVEYFRVDRTTPGLTWSGNNQPPTVWAQCQ